MSAAPDLLTRDPGAPESGASLELAFEALDSAVAILDEHGVVQRCNAAWQTWHTDVFGHPLGVGDDLTSLRTHGAGRADPERSLDHGTGNAYRRRSSRSADHQVTGT